MTMMRGLLVTMTIILAANTVYAIAAKDVKKPAVVLPSVRHGTNAAIGGAAKKSGGINGTDIRSGTALKHHH